MPAKAQKLLLSVSLRALLGDVPGSPAAGGCFHGCSGERNTSAENELTVTHRWRMGRRFEIARAHSENRSAHIRLRPWVDGYL